MNDIESNDATLQSYEAHIQEYISGTPQSVDGHVQDWIDATLKLLLPDAKILEYGSAFGRDALYIESKGFAIERTDATAGFVELLQSQGHEARLLNIVSDKISG